MKKEFLCFPFDFEWPRRSINWVNSMPQLLHSLISRWMANLFTRNWFQIGHSLIVKTFNCPFPTPVANAFLHSNSNTPWKCFRPLAVHHMSIRCKWNPQKINPYPWVCMRIVGGWIRFCISPQVLSFFICTVHEIMAHIPPEADRNTHPLPTQPTIEASKHCTLSSRGRRRTNGNGMDRVREEGNWWQVPRMIHHMIIFCKCLFLRPIKSLLVHTLCPWLKSLFVFHFLQPMDSGFLLLTPHSKWNRE